MKYMIMMNCPRDGYDQFMSWPKEILEAHFAFMETFNEKLRERGRACPRGRAGFAGPGEGGPRR